jgi:HEAT repeat protein
MTSRIALVVCATALVMASSQTAAQVPFDSVVRDLASPQADVRLRAVRLLRDSGYAEAARPLAPLLTDPDDRVQLEAIAAVLNAFFAERVVPRRRVALVVELRNRITAEAAFDQSPRILGGQAVPLETLEGLRLALSDESPLVAREALYALGTLGNEAYVPDQRELRSRAGPQLAALLGHPRPAHRVAAARVIGRLFGWQSNNDPAPEAVGDAVIVALNDNDAQVRAAAMDALGEMRYERALEALTQLFDFYGGGALAGRALNAIARVGHGASVPLFYQQLSDGNTIAKVMAIEGLARTGTVGTLSTIQSAVGGTRNEAIQLAGEFAIARLSKGAVATLADALNRARLHDQAMRYVIEVAPGRVAEFAGGLQSPAARVREDVIYALGLSGDPAARPLLEPMTRDVDEQVARAAEIAIRRLSRIP